MLFQSLPALLPLALILGFAGTACLIPLVMPLLRRYALARPNARSSHKVPTPQGGGAPLVLVALVVTGVLALVSGPVAGFVFEPLRFSLVAGAAAMLAVLGAADDIRPLPAGPRLLVQLACVALLIAVAGGGLRVFPGWPLVAEWVLLTIAGAWFVNLVNFMDGLDWITVAEMVPVTAALAAFGLAGYLPGDAALLAAALCGALAGFALFNKPVAKLFLGDVGSLPIGLLVAWLLFNLAASGHLAAAVLLPLYHLCDATLTLGRRLARRERVWEAHRSHFYQRATDNGFTAMAVSAHVLTCNLGLIALAGLTLLLPRLDVALAACAAGLVLVGLVLYRFSCPRQLTGDAA